jgi:hypothetical protein
LTNGAVAYDRLASLLAGQVMREVQNQDLLLEMLATCDNSLR